MASVALALALAGCAAPQDPAQTTPQSGSPDYMGIRTELLDGDLVRFKVAMRGTSDPRAVTKYAECAAAQYTLIRGFGFARHVRTQVSEEAGIWRADAVYTISAALPQGSRTIDAEVTVADCGAQHIPTV